MHIAKSCANILESHTEDSLVVYFCRNLANIKINIVFILFTQRFNVLSKCIIYFIIKICNAQARTRARAHTQVSPHTRTHKTVAVKLSCVCAFMFSLVYYMSHCCFHFRNIDKKHLVTNDT